MNTFGPKDSKKLFASLFTSRMKGGWRHGQLDPNDFLQVGARVKINQYKDAYVTVQKSFSPAIVSMSGKIQKDCSGFSLTSRQNHIMKITRLTVIRCVGHGPVLSILTKALLVRPLNLDVPPFVNCHYTVLPSHAHGQEEVRVVVVRMHPVTMRTAAAVPRHQNMTTTLVKVVYPPLHHKMTPRIMVLDVSCLLRVQRQTLRLLLFMLHKAELRKPEWNTPEASNLTSECHLICHQRPYIFMTARDWRCRPFHIDISTVHRLSLHFFPRDCILIYQHFYRLNTAFI